MTDPKIIGYIKDAREKDGLTDEVIKKNLLSVGWEEREIEEAFQAIDGLKEEKPTAEILGERKPTPEERPGEEFLREEGFIEEKPKRFQFNKKYLMPLIILVAFVFLASASVFVYNKFFRKIDPISLLPQETAFYLKVKINPEDKQVKNLKEILNKFPYYEKLSQKITESFEKLKEEEPNLKNLDFTISDEIIFAIISPLEENMTDFPLIAILPEPDLEKLEKLAKDVQEELEKSGAWKIEKETYRGRIIVKAASTSPYPYTVGPKIEPSTTLTDGNFVLATKPEDIKKIIDVAEDQKIINIFKGGKEKSINSNTAYKKIKKHLPKDYLATFYGELDWSRIMKSPGIISQVSESEDFLGPLTASLKAALDLPFFKSKKVEESEKFAFAAAIIAEKNELKTEGYSLDLKENAFVPSSFSFQDSLASFVPEKIGNKEVTLYREGRNLKNSLEYFEEALTKQMTAEEKREFDEFLKEFKSTIGVDLKEDIIALFEKNYAFSIYSEPTGKDAPAISLISEFDDENKVKENLLKIKFPNIETSIKKEREKEILWSKNYKLKFSVASIQAQANKIYKERKSYQNVNCNYGEIKNNCNDIKTLIGEKPIIHQTINKYCIYTKLFEPGLYYCVDNTGTIKETYINPGGKNYCTGKTFTCPKTGGTPPPAIIPPEEKASFSKETIDGFEIYSLPVFEKFGLNFAIKDKKLIFTFTKEGLVNVLKSLTDPNQKKLKDSQIFTEQFKEVPKNITGISYSYPYGFLGVAKYTVNFISGLYYAPLISEMVPTEAMPPVEDIVAPFFEFLDKGIAPYLKVLKFASGYSYSPEKGLNIGKNKLVFEDLPPEEKKTTEEFWENIGEWAEENLVPIFGPIYGLPTVPIY